MSTMTATIATVYTKDLSGGKKVYNFKTEEGKWYGAGFDKPDFAEGDTIEFELVEKNGYYNLKPGSAKKIGRPATQDNDTSTTNGARVHNTSTNSERQDSIIYQSSLKTAVEVTKLLLEQGIYKLPAKQADKYDAVKGLLQELANEFAWAAKHPVIEAPVGVVEDAQEVLEGEVEDK